MAKVFITSLGTGKYTPVAYTFEGRALETTRYVQRALLGAYGPTFFDRVVILLTPKAKEMHWAPLGTLRDDLADVVAPDRLLVQDISERIEATAEQWSWFQAVLDHVGQGDDLYLDMTHGFRVVPIVLSAALNYLQAIKGVRLQAAFYGAHDAPGAPIVDFKDFYTLGPWADAVNRLVEKADADKLATLAGSDSNLHFPEFNRPELIDALKALTDALKNIDVNAVASVAQRALGTLRESLAKLDPAASAQRPAPNDRARTRQVRGAQFRGPQHGSL